MGSSASKQGGRQLSKTITDSMSKPIKRSEIDLLKSQKQALQSTVSPDHLHHPSTTTTTSPTPLSGNGQTSPTPDESLDQKETAFRANTSTSFDPTFLHKKIQRHSSATPEGKDGGDPHEQGTSTYDKGFIDSLNQLGKQIKTVEFNPAKDNNAAAIKQLQKRKKLYELGEQEIKDQMSQSVGDGKEVAKSMVHPQTLTAILRDLKDPRVDNQTIVKDYQLKPEFLDNIGDVFQVPTTVKQFEENAKEDEVGHKTVPQQRRSIHETHDENANETVDGETYKKLQKRLSLDD
ncbi:hypothetical protein CANMA_001692 [Candida margitis]|uniref:uncharacterized protein n=1 Tax=Candida margitis TaxID=1775924 RepID=UPI0022261510|nr:uncharacterized protein CANMA_001692 [Candida margitis]KAI5969245.1 hypothetical protein CANMA_001692 [Candida margitis]